MSRRARQRQAAWASKRNWIEGPDPDPEDDQPLDDSEGGHPDLAAQRQARPTQQRDALRDRGE